MTYHILLRYLFIDVLRVVPFVLHHEPSNERGLELSACVQCLDEDFQALCLSKHTSFFPLLYHRFVYDLLCGLLVNSFVFLLCVPTGLYV
ncbi:hypothetical protein OG21DRAFT_727691 [Imleria badia]|nr:hypothetical protein OG21DRAFT_727691 [Imleria badia]